MKWKRLLVEVAVLLVVFGVGGLLVTVSGIMPIKASSGHWPITAWFLNFSMSRSISTHSVGIKVPPLDDRRLVVKGAVHYSIGCAPCHGDPEVNHPRIPQAMTPHPPYLGPKIADWDTEELFYIVKHGVKFTGMPAWPSQRRDDEVWAVTAFMLELPDMTADEYERLVEGDADDSGSIPPIEGLSPPDDVPQAIAQNCSRCHGMKGGGRGLGAFPRLAGQKADYMRAALVAYAEGDRHSGIMEPIAAALSDDELSQLAGYYGGIEAGAPPHSHADETQHTEAIQRGADIAENGILSQKVPACADCHGPGDRETNPHYPVLAGQHASYLVLQLELFKSNNRGGSKFARLMHPVASRLNQEQMTDVARYYASLQPPGTPE